MAAILLGAHDIRSAGWRPNLGRHSGEILWYTQPQFSIMTKVSIVLAVASVIAWTTTVNGIWPGDAGAIWRAGMAAGAEHVALIPASVPPLAVGLPESAHLLLLGAGLFTAAALIRRPRRPM